MSCPSIGWMPSQWLPLAPPSAPNGMLVSMLVSVLLRSRGLVAVQIVELGGEDRDQGEDDDADPAGHRDLVLLEPAPGDLAKRPALDRAFVPALPPLVRPTAATSSSPWGSDIVQQASFESRTPWSCGSRQPETLGLPSNAKATGPPFRRHRDRRVTSARGGRLADVWCGRRQGRGSASNTRRADPRPISGSRTRPGGRPVVRVFSCQTCGRTGQGYFLKPMSS